MSLDPQAEAFVLAARGGPALCDLPVADARLALLGMTATAGGPLPEVGAYEQRTIEGPGDPIPLRIYWPHSHATAKPLPILVFFHGGGFALGEAATHEDICRALCLDAGVVVINVDYRRSPEHPFPAAPEDCYAVLDWAAQSAQSLGGRADRIAVAGDSAGGNLAAVVSQMARDRGGPAIACQVLIYPSTDMSPDFDTPSRRTFGEAGYVLGAKDIDWIIGMYAATPADRMNPYVSPLRATSLANLPPALVITAGYDPLRDEGRMYAEALTSAGGQAEHRDYPGAIHGFVSFSGVIDLGREALAFISERLRTRLFAQV